MAVKLTEQHTAVRHGETGSWRPATCNLQPGNGLESMQLFPPPIPAAVAVVNDAAL